jgi:hypothetical protein
MARKTIEVEKIIDAANKALALEPNEFRNDEWRHGINFMVESILHACDAYAGFGYIETYDGTKFQKGVTNETRIFWRKHRLLAKVERVSA